MTAGKGGSSPRREFECTATIHEWDPERWSYPREYIWQALKRGYVGTFDIDDGDDESGDVPGMCLEIFCLRSAPADRFIAAVSPVTADQPLVLSGHLIYATPENEFAPDDAPSVRMVG